MKITKRQLRRIIKEEKTKIIREAQWGAFTAGAAPLDVPMRDSGPVPKDQLRKIADIFMNDMGMTPEEVLEKPEFVEQGITDLSQLDEGKMKITKRQLHRVIKEEKSKLLNENTPAANAERMQGTYSDITMMDAVTNSLQALLTQTETDAYEDLGDDEEAAISAEAAVTLTVAQAFEKLGMMDQYHMLSKTL
jgi:hypothetical protein